MYDSRFRICCNEVINPRTGISPACCGSGTRSAFAAMGGYRQAVAATENNELVTADCKSLATS